MPYSFGDRLQHAWNAFRSREPTNYGQFGYGFGMSSARPYRSRARITNERTIVTAVITRIAVDCADIDIRHVLVDENENFKENIQNDSLNEILCYSANIDQTGRAFILDLIQSLLDEGVVAVVPVDTDIDPNTGSFKILSARVGKIVEWMPRHVRINVYNDQTGVRQDIVMRKDKVAIIENPFYQIMNEPNSVLRRLTRKLSLLDVIDEQSGSGKLDLILQLPYIVKTPAKKELADRRRKEIEEQLSNTKYGIAYTDGTERIVQLNRPIENNLMSQIEYLTSMLYSQLGMTDEIMKGTADEATMNNYYSRVIAVILTAVVEELQRKFLTKTARTQRHRIMFFRDPFKLVTASAMAELADKFTRNEILAPNEIRGIVGFKPSEDPRANELRNRNLNQEKDAVTPPTVGEEQAS